MTAPAPPDNQPTRTPSDAIHMERAALNGLPPFPPLPNGYILRLRTDADDVSLAHTLDAAFGDIAFGNGQRWTTVAVQDALIDDPTVAGTYLIVHEPTGTVAATASVQFRPQASVPGQPPAVGTLHWVATHPDHLGKRLGYLVSLAVLHDFAQRGCSAANLTTQYYRLPAIHTYLKLGFAPTDNGNADEAAHWKSVMAQLRPGQSEGEAV